MPSYRFDKATLKPLKRLKDGRVRAEAVMTRTGVFAYQRADGSTRREYRSPEEVFHPDSLESFAQVPVTNTHPPVMLDADNATKYAVGAMGDTIRRDGDLMIGTLTVYDRTTIREMDAGKTQVSNGYECELDETPGVSPEGEAYDARQYQIRGNHLAIVEAGRAGNAACVRMDGADSATMVASAAALETVNMEELAKVQAALAVALARITELEAALPKSDEIKLDHALRTRCDKLEAERDSVRAELAKLTAARTDEANTLGARVRARVDLETTAGAVLDGADLAPMTERAIRVAVVKKLDGADVADDKSDDYVTARFDAAVERHAGARDALGTVRAAVNDRKDAAIDADPEQAARDRQAARSRDAHKKGI